MLLALASVVNYARKWHHNLEWSSDDDCKNFIKQATEKKYERLELTFI